MTMREPMSTAAEFDPVEIAMGADLDDEGLKNGVLRLEAEPDATYRERIKDAIRVRRASERAERGESLVPEGVRIVDPEGEIETLRRENAYLREVIKEIRRLSSSII